MGVSITRAWMWGSRCDESIVDFRWPRAGRRAACGTNALGVAQRREAATLATS